MANAVQNTAAVQIAANENNHVDQDALGLHDLAKGVLDRAFRPRAASIRRLAQAVLSHQELIQAPKPEKKEKKKTSNSNKAAKSKKGSKKRKLAKIPGQKGK